LAECGITNRLETFDRLTKPPKSLHIPTADHAFAANSLINTAVGFDGDMAAQMLRRNEGHPNPEATWKGLTRAERKRAKRLWAWALDAGLDVAPQGRPLKIDPALVLYCSRVLTEACGLSRFAFSRPSQGGRPRGPLWRALTDALPRAQLFLRQQFEGTPDLTP